MGGCELGDLIIEVEENEWYDEIEVTTSRARWTALCRDGLENYDDVKTT